MLGLLLFQRYCLIIYQLTGSSLNLVILVGSEFLFSKVFLQYTGDKEIPLVKQCGVVG